MRHAIVKNSKVINVLDIPNQEVLDSLVAELQVEITPSDTCSIGNDYIGGIFVDNTPVPVVPDPTWKWYLDVGPFFDRFGAIKMAILTSSNSGVKALLQDIQIRKWIDLKNPEVASGLAYIGSIIPALDATMQDTILNTVPTLEENLALRKLYF